MLPLRSRVQSWYSTSRTALFGLSLSLPTPSNLPLAGTGAPGSGGPPWLLIAKVVVALPAALWIYKVGCTCFRLLLLIAALTLASQSALLVLLQRRIIYLPSVPPGTRNESLEHGARSTQRDADLAGLAWRQVAVESSRPSRFLRRKVTLHGIELEQSKKHLSLAQQSSSHVVIVYLQGESATRSCSISRIADSSPPLQATPALLYFASLFSAVFYYSVPLLLLRLIHGSPCSALLRDHSGRRRERL